MKSTRTGRKLSVILSFAAIGGVVSIEDRMETGDVNVLNMLKDTKNVSDEDYNYFIDCFLELLT